MQGYARLSTTTSRSLRRMVFKPIEGQRRVVFDSRVWFWTVGVSLSYFARVYRVEYLSFLRILSFQLLIIFQLDHTTWYFLTGFCAFDIPILQLKCYFSSHIYAQFLIKHESIFSFNGVLNLHDRVLMVETHLRQGNNPQFLFCASTRLYDAKHLRKIL